MNSYLITISEERNVLVTAPDTTEALRTVRARYGGRADITAVMRREWNGLQRTTDFVTIYRKTADGVIVEG